MDRFSCYEINKASYYGRKYEEARNSAAAPDLAEPPSTKKPAQRIGGDHRFIGFLVQPETGIRSNTNAKEKNRNASKADFDRLVGEATRQPGSGET